MFMICAYGVFVTSICFILDEPYKVEIADSNLVLTEGAGLSLAKINQVARFAVDVGNAGSGDVVVDMRGKMA